MLNYLVLESNVQFQTFSQRVEEIEIDVFRSLHPLKSEPSEGSSFFRDCLVEWRVCRILQIKGSSL